MISLPLIETDTIFAFINKKDKYHTNAFNLIKKINNGFFQADFSSISLIELNFIYKKFHLENEFEIDLGNLQGIKNIKWAPLNIRNFLTALIINKTYNIPFYNSLHAGIAINLDRVIITQNTDFDVIAGLSRMPLSDF